MTTAGRRPGRARLLSVFGAGLLAVLGLVGVVVLAGGSDDDTVEATSPLPEQRGRFVVECTHSHSAPDDPIVHPGLPGYSHLHDFFGNVAVDAFSTAESIAEEDTTCEVRQDHASYWAPALYQGDRVVPARSSDAYYRAARGVDPTAVEPYPFGFVAIGGDPVAEEPQPTDVVGWGCGRDAIRSSDPPFCPESKPLALHVTFPACWDGERLDSLDHRNHVVYGERGVCPDTHPVHVPELELVVQYEHWGDPAGLRLASGSIYSGHADFLNAWDPDKLSNEVRHCIHRDVVCGIPSI